MARTSSRSRKCDGLSLYWWMRIMTTVRPLNSQQPPMASHCMFSCAVASVETRSATAGAPECAARPIGGVTILARRSEIGALTLGCIQVAKSRFAWSKRPVVTDDEPVVGVSGATHSH